MGLGNWYDEHVVPRLIRCACSGPAIMKLREAVVPLATGAVLELGCGGGLNQRFFDPAKITSYAGVDPSAKGLEFARAEAARKGWVHDIRAGLGEAIPFSDASFDSVVCTFTLCSVQDPGATLAELRRVLKPGGQLLFAEHGAAPDAGVAKWQARIEPVWKRIGGNCHLTRPITGSYADAGFKIAQAEKGYMPKTPRPFGWIEWGEARI